MRRVPYNEEMQRIATRSIHFLLIWAEIYGKKYSGAVSNYINYLQKLSGDSRMKRSITIEDWEKFHVFDVNEQVSDPEVGKIYFFVRPSGSVLIGQYKTKVTNGGHIIRALPNGNMAFSQGDFAACQIYSVTFPESFEWDKEETEVNVIKFTPQTNTENIGF